MRFSAEQAFRLGLVRDAKGGWLQPIARKSQAPGDAPPVERERGLHEEILKWITDHGWEVVHSRMDMRTSVDEGLPDFVVAAPNGITFWIECKARREKPKPNQVAWGIRLTNLGHRYGVVWNMRDFLAIVGE